MKNLVAFAFLAILIILSGGKVDAQQIDINYFDDNYIRNQNYVYVETVRSMQIFPQGKPLDYPVIELESDDKIELHFDDLSNYVKTLTYRIYHCTSDWKTDDLFYSDYVDGFEINILEDYAYSQNTIQEYIHYQLQIPNENCRPTLSGNYLLVVYDGHGTDKPLLSARFQVFENVLPVSVNVQRPKIVESMYTHQYIQVEVEQVANQVRDASRDVKIRVVQNGRHDRELYLEQADYITGDKLIYNSESKNVIQGGTEFNYFDAKNVRFKELETDSLYYDGFYHIVLKPDRLKTYESYTYEQDINGNYVVKLESSNESHLRADYVFVHFQLPWNQEIIGGNLYIGGHFAYNQLRNSNKLIYNAENRAYEKTLLLKQGYYNYNYVFVDDKQAQGRKSMTQASYYQTENDYQVFVFVRDIYLNYERLMAYKLLNTKQMGQ